MTRAVAITVGAEQYGLSDFWLQNADFQVKIPMLGKIDSLNVSTAATILLYEAARQRNWKKA
jgi:TrmH family RNA methyltransferase